MHRALVLAVAIQTLLLTSTVSAQDDTGDLDIRAPDEPEVTILPRPDSGSAPETPGDPGGWQQLTLLALIVVALVVITLLVWRQARRARRRA